MFCSGERRSPEFCDVITMAYYAVPKSRNSQRSSLCISPFMSLIWLYFKWKYSFAFHLPLLTLYLSRLFCCCAVLFMWAFAWVSCQRIFLTNLLLMAWGFRDIYWKHMIRFQAACREEGDLGSKLQMLLAVFSDNICHNLEYARCRKFLLPRLGPVKWDIYNFRLLPEFPEGKQLRDCC